MITVIIISIILGVCLTLLVQFLWFYKKFNTLPKLEKTNVDQFPPVKLPKVLKEKLTDKETLGKKQSCLWFNILSQYLFQELRDTQQVRRFIMKKMNREFEELLQTTSGKFLDQIIVRDFSLGTTFPIVNNVAVKNVVFSGDKLEELDLGLDVDYNGGFQIALDVFLVFNKSAYLSVTLKKLKGYARLQLTRTPYTHWSFSFYDDPEVDFAVESQFEGRQLPQVANIIITQLRRSIRKKHTLPNYKMRFRPFFFQPEIEKPLRDLTVNGNNITIGKLDVQVKECSRLLKTPKDSFLYCSLSIDYLPYKELVNSRRRVWVTHDIEVYKYNAQSVGLSFKEKNMNEKNEYKIFWSSLPGLPKIAKWPVNIVAWTLVQLCLLIQIMHMSLKRKPQTLNAFQTDVQWALGKHSGTKKRKSGKNVKVKRDTDEVEGFLCPAEVEGTAPRPKPVEKLALRCQVVQAEVEETPSKPETLEKLALGCQVVQAEVEETPSKRETLEKLELGCPIKVDRTPDDLEEPSSPISFSNFSSDSEYEPSNSGGANSVIFAFSQNDFSTSLQINTSSVTKTCEEVPESDESPELGEKTVKTKVRKQTSHKVRKQTSLNEEEIERDVNFPNIYVRKVMLSKVSKLGKKKKNEHVWNPAHSCLFCHKVLTNISKHLIKHENEKEVQEIKKLGKTLGKRHKMMPALQCLLNQEQLLDRYETAVIVDLVVPESPAALADIRKGDVLISIGLIKISSTRQAAKLIKTAGEKFMVRLERAQIKLNQNTKFTEETLTVKDTVSDFEYSEEFAGSDAGDEFVSISLKPEAKEESKTKLDKAKLAVHQTLSANHLKPRSRTTVSDNSLEFLKKKNSDSPQHLGTKRDHSPLGLRTRTYSDPCLANKILNDDVDSIHSTETDGGTVSDSDDDFSNVQKTKEVKSSQNPQWGHTVSFDVTEQLRYLNLCVWCKILEKTDKGEKVVKPERHLLVGHVNIPLSDLCLECLITLQGKTKYTVKLIQGEMKATASRSKTGNYTNLPGFDSQLCYGDVTLLVKFSPANLNKDDRCIITKEPFDSTVVHERTREEKTLGGVKHSDGPVEANHLFNGAQFPSATYCNFCGKKIWLKVAFQCCQCSMICHKKCVEKCQADTLCTKNGAKHRDNPDKEWTTPVVTSRLKKVQEYKEGVAKSKLLSKFRKESPPPPHTPVKKNVPSTLNLSTVDVESKTSPTLTPSPRLSPRLLRKVPKVVLEAGDSTTKVLDEVDSDEEQNAALRDIYEKRDKGLNLDEMVVTAAKQMGRELFTHLSISERKNKLDHMVSKLQLEIDQETGNKAVLTRSLQDTSDPSQRQAIQQHLVKSEEKGDALMMLLLHYCAGLQHCLDQEQEERHLDDQKQHKNEDLNLDELEECVESENEIFISSEDIQATDNIDLDSKDDSSSEDTDSDGYDSFEKFRALANQNLSSGVI